MPEKSAQTQAKESTTSIGRTFIVIAVIVIVIVLLGTFGIFLQQKSSKNKGGSNETTTTIKTSGGETVRQGELPDNFPKDVTIYKGSNVSSSTESKSGFSVTLNTSDSVKTVTDFYTGTLKKNEWKIQSSSTVLETSLITADKGKRSLVMTINRDETTGDRTVITIIIKNI